MPPLKEALKNEYTKRIMYATGVKHPQQLPRRETPHYRMPKLVANGGYMILDRYRGPEIPPQEWETLEYTTYADRSEHVLRADYLRDGQDRA